MAQAGYIDQQTAVKLLDFPDLQSVENLLAAMENWIQQQMDSIVDDGKYIGPDSLMDLTMARRLGTMEYALGAASKLEPAKLQQLRTWIAQVDDLVKKATQPPPAAPGVVPAQAPGVPLTAAPQAAPQAAPAPMPAAA